MKKITTYTVIDIETPNHANDSICAIAIINVVDDKVVFEKEFFVNPEAPFDSFNTALHGISSNMVKNEKTFDKVWLEISKYFTNGLIIGHNVTFDLNVISKVLYNYEINVPNYYYIDTCSMGKGIYCDSLNHKLDTLCDHLNIDFKNHHNAKSDTKACYDIFKRIQEDYTIHENDINIYTFGNQYTKKVNKTITEKSINSFYGIIKGITADKVLNELEVKEIKKWLNENVKYRKSSPYTEIISCIENVLEDEKITADEQIQLLKVAKQFKSSNIFCNVTLSLQVLMGILEGITCDKKLNTLEIIGLRKWMFENEILKGNFPFDVIFENITKVLEDDVVSEKESEILYNLFDEFLNPLNSSNKEILMLHNSCVCLTGDFTNSSKAEIEAKIIELGGNVVKNVTSKINYLIVGGEGSKDLSFGNYDSKIKKAMEFNEKGKNIKIISEVDIRI